MLLILQSAPCRLAPNEALPHTPLGALPLDPTSPLASGLSLRFIARYARCLCTTLISYAHSSLLIYPCSICHTPLLSSPISPPKYHQAYQSFPISTSNLLPLLTVYSFWLYNKGGELIKRRGRKVKMEEEHPIDPIDPIELYYTGKS